MKALFFILLLSICSSIPYACECVSALIPYKEVVKQYDFIAFVKIKSAGRFGIESRKSIGGIYVQVETLELFKGKIKDSIFVAGNGTNCDLAIRIGQEWLIYGDNNDNIQIVQPCSHTNLVRLENGSLHFNSPIFEQSLYKTQDFFRHPFTLLKNGRNIDKRPNLEYYSEYHVKNNKLDGKYIHVRDNVLYYNFNFTKGVADGINYKINPTARWIEEYIYHKGQLQSLKLYNITDTISIPFSDVDFFKKQLARKKYTSSIWLYMDDGSRLSREFYPDGNLASIVHQDSVYKNNFREEFDNNGKRNFIFFKNELTDETESLSYHSNGKLKISIKYRGINGILKEFDEDGNLIKNENLTRK